ncbi:outer membrane beta-barrel protein [Flavobacteriaceae bacterium]|nr:outer membrane beta-barrel protein [Flavobacteriaceae bacterium]
MKKIILTCLLLNSLMIYAQEKSDKLKIGVELGIVENLSSKIVAFNLNEGYNISYNKFNFKLNISGDFYISEKLSLSSGLSYSQNNYTVIPYTPSFIAIFEDEIKLNFIEIPVSMRYFFLNKKLTPFINIGIVNQLIFDDDDLENPTFPLEGNKYGVSGKLGAGMEYELNKMAIRLYADYVKGFSNIYSNLDYKIDYISFGAGIVIGI